MDLSPNETGGGACGAKVGEGGTEGMSPTRRRAPNKFDARACNQQRWAHDAVKHLP
jgi:hypothetical protein